jgi:hypothetical protein
MGQIKWRSRLLVWCVVLLPLTALSLWGCGGSGGQSGGGSSATSVRVVFPGHQASLEPGDIADSASPSRRHHQSAFEDLRDDLKGLYAIRFAYAQVIPGVPPNVASLLLIITGANMSPVQANIDLSTGRVTVNVPVGNDRLFEVRAFPAGSAIPNFIGRTMANVSPDGTNVTVNMETVNPHPPVANAGPGQTSQVGQTVQLDGSRSSDVDGDPLTFRWAFTTRPPESQATLVNPTLVNPTFVVDEPGTYVVQLIVNDGLFDSPPATVRIDTLNTCPVANAGPTQTSHVGQTVQLDGSRSGDVDGDPLTFRWAFTTRPPESQATLVNPTLVNPTFVVDEPGTYVVQLIVNDGFCDSLPATVRVDTLPICPVANAGPGQTSQVGQTVQLDGSRSGDVDGDPLTFRWAFTTRPPESQATLVNPTLVNPTFVVDEPGTYVVQLIVNDGFCDSLPATVRIDTLNTPPEANAGLDQTVSVGEAVQLDGSRSSDVDGDLLTFRWAFTTRPPESQATLVNPTLVNPTFVVDEPGTYVVQLIVNDGLQDSESPDSVVITAGALPVRNCDDCFFPQALPFPFPFFGQLYTSVFVSNNGLVTFNFGTGDYTETKEEFTIQPAISPFWDDIITGSDSPLGSGLYVNNQLSDQFVVTWFRQQEYCGNEAGLTCIGDNPMGA